MEHLPRPSPATVNNANVPEPIPFLGNCLLRYCKHGENIRGPCSSCPTYRWSNYWSRANIRAMDVFDGSKPSPDDIYAYLGSGLAIYAWMYFGVLIDFFEGTVDLKIFQRKDSLGGEGYLDTTRLDNEIYKWHLEMIDSDDDRYQKWHDTIEELFECVLIMWSFISEAYYKLPQRFPKGGLIMLRILYDTLWSAVQSIDGKLWEKYDWKIGDTELTELLTSNGWCMSEINRIGRPIVSSVAIYGALLGVRSNDSHRNCKSDYHCDLMQTDDATYQVRHIDGSVFGDFPYDSSNMPGDNLIGPNAHICDKVVLSTETLLDIISAGLVPLILVDDNCNIRLVGCRLRDTKYIAISHVWADGCGNPVENSLPRCQIEQIKQQMSLLYDDRDKAYPCFLDTLCVPVPNRKDARYEDAIAGRKWMISIMNEIYQSAYVVLVRDRQLMSLSRHISIPEQAARVVFSHWHSRLWTMQEGTAARDLRFCMADGLIERFEIWSQLKKQRPYWKSMPSRRGPPVERQCTDVWSYLLENIEPLQVIGPGKGWGERMHKGLLAGSNKAISRAQDEIVCIGGMTRLSQDEVLVLLNLNDEERTIQFLRFFRGFPSGDMMPYSVVTDNAERISIKGYRWCPRRLLRHYSGWDFRLQQCSEGLYGSWSTIYFEFPRQFVFKEDQQRTKLTFFIRIRRPGQETQYGKVLLDPRWAPLIVQSEWRNGKPLALLRSPFRNTAVNDIPAALVSVEGHKAMSEVIGRGLSRSGTANVGRHIGTCLIRAVGLINDEDSRTIIEAFSTDIGGDWSGEARWLID